MALVQNLGQSFNLMVLHGSESDVSLSLAETIKVQELKWNWQYFLSRTVRVLRRHTGLNLSAFFEKRVGFSFTFLSLSYSFQKVLNVLDTSNFHLVITLSQGESFVPHHAVLKSSRFHEKWLAYIHDPYPMACYPKSYAWDGPGTNQKKEFMQAVCDYASFLSFPSLLLSEWMQKFYRFDSKKVKIIPHQIDRVLKKKSELRHKSFFDKKKFNLLYAGHLLSQRNPFPIIDAFNLFIDEYNGSFDNCQLTFIGPVSSAWKNKLTEISSDHIKFYPTHDFEFTIQLQQQASVNIIIEANDDHSPFLPAKFPHCVFSQRPMLVLSPLKSELRRILGETFPFISPPTDTQAILENIKQLYENWKEEKKYTYVDSLQSYLKEGYLIEVMEEILNHGT